ERLVASLLRQQPADRLGPASCAPRHRAPQHEGGDHMTTQQHWRARLNSIIDEVAQAHGVTRDELLGPSKRRRFVAARQEAMYRGREAKFSLLELAEVFGRDHTTVRAACLKVAARKGREAA